MHPFPAYAQTRPQPMAVYFKIRVDRLLADLCIVRARRQVMRNRVPDLWRHPATDHELSSSSTLVSRCSTIQANLCMYIYIYISIPRSSASRGCIHQIWNLPARMLPITPLNVNGCVLCVWGRLRRHTALPPPKTSCEAGARRRRCKRKWGRDV